jgi:hypothetical protein
MVPSVTITINLTFLQCGFGHDHHLAHFLLLFCGCASFVTRLSVRVFLEQAGTQATQGFCHAVGSPTQKGTLFGPILDDIITRLCIRFHPRRITSLPAQSTPPKSTQVMQQLLLYALRAMPHTARGRLLIRRLPAQKTLRTKVKAEERKKRGRKRATAGL